jgi:hypothetical protein
MSPTPEIQVLADRLEELGMPTLAKLVAEGLEKQTADFMEYSPISYDIFCCNICDLRLYDEDGKYYGHGHRADCSFAAIRMAVDPKFKEAEIEYAHVKAWQTENGYRLSRRNYPYPKPGPCPVPGCEVHK